MGSLSWLLGRIVESADEVLCVAPARLSDTLQNEFDDTNCGNVLLSVADMDVFDALNAIKDEAADCLISLRQQQQPAQMSIERTADEDEWVYLAPMPSHENKIVDAQGRRQRMGRSWPSE